MKYDIKRMSKLDLAGCTLARDNLIGGKEIDQTSVWDLLSTHNGNTIRLFYIVRRVK